MNIASEHLTFKLEETRQQLERSYDNPSKRTNKTRTGRNVDLFGSCLLGRSAPVARCASISGETPSLAPRARPSDGEEPRLLKLLPCSLARRTTLPRVILDARATARLAARHDRIADLFSHTLGRLQERQRDVHLDVAPAREEARERVLAVHIKVKACKGISPSSTT